MHRVYMDVGIVFFLIILFSPSQFYSQWFDEQSINATVLLEKKQNDKIVPHGTGFLVYNYNEPYPIVVTCAHLLRRSEIYVSINADSSFISSTKESGVDTIAFGLLGSFKITSKTISDLKREKVPDNILNRLIRHLNKNFENQNIFIKELISTIGLQKTQQYGELILKNGSRSKRVWVKDGFRLRCTVNLSQNPKTFVTHPILDIGAFLIDLPTAVCDDSGKVVQQITRVQSIPKSAFKFRKDVSLGNETYFVGFPHSIGADLNRIEPLVRSGSVAWISQQIPIFLLDAFSYPGNSGSPVYTKILFGHEPGNPFWGEAKLIGMVNGHLAATVERVMTQPITQSDPSFLTLSFQNIEQNWGLATCFWMDDILEVVKAARELEMY